jgi:lipoprotein signal peptidase
MRALIHKIAIVALLVGIADQITKTLARILLPICTHAGQTSCAPIGTGLFRFLRMGNGGSALGFAQGEGLWTLLALGGCALTLCYCSRRPGMLLGLAAGLQLGGAASNLADRLVTGAVTDFFVAGPIVLNLADLALVAGTAIAVCVLMTEPIDRPDRSNRRLKEEVRPR